MEGPSESGTRVLGEEEITKENKNNEGKRFALTVETRRSSVGDKQVNNNQQVESVEGGGEIINPNTIDKGRVWPKMMPELSRR